MKVAIIGGGAAGFFSAINVKYNFPDASVTIFEKTSKVLSKVKISGGGRCNVTNGCQSISVLSTAYPRGSKLLKKAFSQFHTKHTMEWFETRGVPLMVQEDGCVFPVSQNSQSIIDCFLNECRKLQIRIEMSHGISSIQQIENQISLGFSKENIPTKYFDKVIIATGGSPKMSGLQWLADLGHSIVDPVPSLFTFNMPAESIKELMGVVVENALVDLPGTNLKSQGPLLITHWGMSGPAILVLSAFGARLLFENQYTFSVRVNWVGEKNHDLVRNTLLDLIETHPKKMLSSIRPYFLPDRLWQFLLKRHDISHQKKWEELGKKGVNKLIAILTNDIYQVQGKTTFKEEFVTCGGVSLDSIHTLTMESKSVPNLYFAGEVLDIDGITGGYNFQSAWTTGFIASKLS